MTAVHVRQKLILEPTKTSTQLTYTPNHKQATWRNKNKSFFFYTSLQFPASHSKLRASMREKKVILYHEIGFKMENIPKISLLSVSSTHTKNRPYLNTYLHDNVWIFGLLLDRHSIRCEHFLDKRPE